MTLNLNDEAVRGGTLCLSKAGLAEGTNDATIKIAADNGAGVDFAINGTLYHKADTDNIDPTACTEQALGTTCLYLITLTTAGVVDAIKGTEVDSDDLASGKTPCEWPSPAEDTCVIGALKIVAGTTAFQLGVDDLTDDIGTGSVTYYDLFSVPVDPITS